MKETAPELQQYHLRVMTRVDSKAAHFTVVPPGKERHKGDAGGRNQHQRRVHASEALYERLGG